jgi:hypothetical protein
MDVIAKSSDAFVVFNKRCSDQDIHLALSLSLSLYIYIYIYIYIQYNFFLNFIRHEKIFSFWERKNEFPLQIYGKNKWYEMWSVGKPKCFLTCHIEYNLAFATSVILITRIHREPSQMKLREQKISLCSWDSKKIELSRHLSSAFVI